MGDPVQSLSKTVHPEVAGPKLQQNPAHRPCEAGAIAAGAFDAERLDPPVRVCPPDQGPIAPRIRHERVVAEAGPPRCARRSSASQKLRQNRE